MRRLRGARAILPNEQFFALTIRAAEVNDAATLAQLMCELGYETTKSEMQMRVERITTDERCRTFVAVCDGKNAQPRHVEYDQSRTESCFTNRHPFRS